MNDTASTTPLAHLMMYDREDRPWAGNRLVSASIIGHTTATTSRIWLRVHRPGHYVLVLDTQPIDTTRQPALTDDGAVILGGMNRPLATKQVYDINYDSKKKTKRKIGFETDLTAVVEAEKLEEGTTYFYAAFEDDETRAERWEIGRDEALHFRTRPEEPAGSCFGLFSCHMPFKGHSVCNMHMWDAFHAELGAAGADFVIGGGDQVYTDGDKRVSIWRYLKSRKRELKPLKPAERLRVMTSWYRDIYRGYWGHPALRGVFRRFPHYMIWDDHEIMDGWGSYTPAELSQHLDTIWEWENKTLNRSLANTMFAAARRVYFEYQHSHNPPTPGDPSTLSKQWDYTFEWGPDAFFFLDMRGHRKYAADPARSTILGSAQRKRLAAWFKGAAAARANALFIVSPVPVIHLKDFVTNHLDLPALGLADDLRDEWEHRSNRREFHQLLDLAFDHSHQSGKHVVFLSGDVHIGGAFKLARASRRKAKVYQLTSSGITYCKAPGRLLRLVMKGNRKLAGLPGSKATTFERIHAFEENNFGIVRTRPDGPGGYRVCWDLFGNSGKEDEIIRLRRVELS